MKKLLRKTGITAFVMFLVAGLIMSVRAEEGKDFDAFLEDEWREMMESSYIDMHFAVKDPEAMGLEKPEVTFGDVTYELYYEAADDARASLDALHAYDYESLNDTQQHDYLVYERYLEDTIALNSMPDFDELFNPYSGDLDNIITIMTEFIFYRQEDIDDYLTLTGDIPRYIDQMLAFTAQQAGNGFFMTDRCLDEQLSSLAEFTAKGEENPLIIIFNERVDAFEGLTNAERDAYKKKNRDLVINGIYPAYDKIAATLPQYRGIRADAPVTAYPGGDEYYAALARMKCSSNDDLQTMYDYMRKALKDTMDYYIALYLSEGTEETSQIEMSDPQEVLDYLQSHLEGFPKGPDVTYTPSYLDPSVANPSVVAYYMTTPIDDLTDNVIRINGTNLSPEETNDLYYTLAHEGFPGHLYQFTWYQDHGYNPIRHDISVMGYQEGWAQYVEKIMLERAPIDHYSAEDTALNTFLGYVMQAAADVAVNGLHMSQEDLAAWFEEEGFNPEAVAPVYESCVDMPGQILPYGYGMAKFWELRERTEVALGDKFDLEDYHLQILLNGPRPFDIVESDLQKYVEAKGASLPEEYTFFGSESEGVEPDRLYAWVTEHIGMILIGILVLFLLFIILIIWLIRRFLKRRKRKRLEREAQEEAERLAALNPETEEKQDDETGI